MFLQKMCYFNSFTKSAFYLFSIYLKRGRRMDLLSNQALQFTQCNLKTLNSFICSAQGSPSMSNSCRLSLHISGVISFGKVKHTNLIHITQKYIYTTPQGRIWLYITYICKILELQLKSFLKFYQFLQFTFGDLNNTEFVYPTHIIG